MDSVVQVLRLCVCHNFPHTQSPSILDMMNIILIQVWENAQQLVLALSNRAAAAWASLLVSKCQGEVGQMVLGGHMYGIAEAREANSSW